MFTYKGYEYVPMEEYEPEEATKIFHDVKMPNGEMTHVDFSSYSKLSLNDFKKWVDLGMPDRGDKCGPLRSDDLENLWVNSLRFMKE